jgi:hypothetical protein
MKITMPSVRTKAAALAVGALIAVGGATTAFAAQDGGGNGSSTTATTVAPSASGGDTADGPKVCARLPKIEQRIRTRHDHLTDRLAKLRQARQQAVDAKQPAKVARIDQRISHVVDRIARLEQRTTKLAVWAKAHCNT